MGWFWGPERKWRASLAGSVVKNPSVNAGDMGSIPGTGRPHMLQSNKACELLLLSLCPRACALQPGKPQQWEAWVPHTATREQPPRATTREKDPAQPKINFVLVFLKIQIFFKNLTVNYLLKEKERKKENGDLSATVARRWIMPITLEVDLFPVEPLMKPQSQSARWDPEQMTESSYAWTSDL